MSRKPVHSSGITLVEVVVAMFLLCVAIAAALSLQPAARQLASRADQMGRACGLIENEMETLAVKIMNATTDDPAGLSDAGPRVMFAGGGTIARPGDAVFFKTAQVTSSGPNLWQVRVTITWPGNDVGITETRLITRQDDFTR